MPHPSFYKDVYPHFQIPLKEFIEYHYINLSMSDIDIIEMIKQFTDIKFSRTALSRWHKRAGITARTPHARFQLAIDTGKIDHKLIAQKSIVKTAKRIKGRSYLQSKPSTRLNKLLKESGKSQAELSRYLGVSTGCVNAWCSCEAMVHPDYWKRIEKFLELPHEEIFSPSSRPVSVPRFLSEQLGVSIHSVYNWLWGRTKPGKKCPPAIKQMIKNYRKKYRRPA
jgi:DNA-binding transcriptional regulator YiaG